MRRYNPTTGFVTQAGALGRTAQAAYGLNDNSLLLLTSTSLYISPLVGSTYGAPVLLTSNVFDSPVSGARLAVSDDGIITEAWSNRVQHIDLATGAILDGSTLPSTYDGFKAVGPDGTFFISTGSSPGAYFSYEGDLLGTFAGENPGAVQSVLETGWMAIQTRGKS